MVCLGCPLAWRAVPDAFHPVAGQRHCHLHDQRWRTLQQKRGRGCGQRSHQQRAFATDDDEAELRRQRVHSAVRMSGAARVSVFCQENQVPKAPWYM